MQSSPPLRRRARCAAFTRSSERLRPLAAGLGILALAPSAKADSPLTLPQAISIALQRNTDARSAAADVKNAHGALVQSRAFDNPNLFLGSYGTPVNPASWPHLTQIGATWTLPIGGKRAAGIASANAALKAASATRTSVVQQVELNVAEGYVNVQLNQALLDFAHQDQQSFERTLELNQVRYNDGQIAYGDLLKLKLQELAIGDEVRQAETTLVQARADLVQLLGLQEDASTLTVAGALAPVPSQAPTLEGLVADAERDRPDLKASVEQSESAQAALTVQKRQPIPDLGILAEYNHTRGNPDTFDLVFTVALPLLDQNRGNIESAEAAYSKAQLGNEALELDIRDAAAKALEELRASQAQLSAYQAGVAQAQESLEISRHAFQEGSGSLLDFLDAENSYRQVEVSLRNATAREALAAYNLRFIAGKGVQ